MNDLHVSAASHHENVPASLHHSKFEEYAENLTISIPLIIRFT